MRDGLSLCLKNLSNILVMFLDLYSRKEQHMVIGVKKNQKEDDRNKKKNKKILSQHDRIF